MNVIFLDIDGVLVTWNTVGVLDKETRSCALQETCVHMLNKLARITESKIVLSSTWRFHDWDRNMEHFKKFKMDPLPFDKTGMDPSGIRGKEIKKWLDEHPEVKNFVILDDDSDMEELMDHLVHTNMETGLTSDHCDKALEILGFIKENLLPQSNKNFLRWW